ncbi:threonine synthase [Arsenicibacter rosenii]|uniref:Threonine synthase n=2 Tax=Arsenicibacter rosenii TaxID=1750698 RepID=A0A1S2VLA4_9BACT|nr:threonine synthase [Arsenicibacter rosenii]
MSALPASPTTYSLFDHLICSACRQPYTPAVLHTLSPCCHMPLLAQYTLTGGPDKRILLHREGTMWRYREVLPVFSAAHQISLGEGFTPMLGLNRLGAANGFSDLWLKDEGKNPTGSFKARGLSMAISKAHEYGVEGCIIPTAGNAGVAMAAYCARAAMQAVVVMPRHTPKAFQEECYWYGADVHLIDGLINDCAAKVRQLNSSGQWLDLSTLKEPYRIEGKKTMGYEIAEQMNWQLPDVILYPAGGGTGLIGIWKAFREMQQLGWLPADIRLPRMVAVQAENCQPLVDTWLGKQPNAQQYNGKPTLANGLAVPRPIGEPLMLNVLHESRGLTLGISEADMVDSVREIGKTEGVFLAPEGAALWTAARQLLRQGWLSATDRVLLLNTGNGQKYLDNLRPFLTD